MQITEAHLKINFKWIWNKTNKNYFKSVTNNFIMGDITFNIQVHQNGCTTIWYNKNQCYVYVGAAQITNANMKRAYVSKLSNSN